MSKQYGKLDLRNMDCMDLLRESKDNEYDLCIADPPYGIKINMNAGRKKTAAAPKRKNKKWDNEIPTDEYFREIRRVSRNQIIWGGNYFKVLPVTQSWIFWDKCVAAGASFADGELAWTSFECALKKVIIPWSGFIGAEDSRIHPTQKSIKLYKWLLQNYAKSKCKRCRGGGEMPDDDFNPVFCTDCNGTGTYHAKILDTHLGSGSIAIACYYDGFDLTGSELDPDYYKAMMERIDRETREQELF